MCVLKLGGKHNKQRSAMDKLSNIVHSGWMTKSPPEQRLQSPLKIFRAKWKQRFFVLHKPTGSLPDQYELSYYSSEQCSKKKGSIDLDQCEQIIESLNSDQYPYLLAIKTICRGKVRTYYLATKSEESMTTWVQCLCRVCGLKQEDTPTDIPDARLSCYGTSGTATTTPGHHTAQGSTTTGGTTAAAAAPAPTVTSQPSTQVPFTRATTVASSSSSSIGSNPPPSTSPQSYVFLNDCTTGPAEKRSDRYGRTDSVDSVPEYQAPPPPAKKGSHFLHNNNNNNEESPKDGSHENIFDMYDRPPPAGQDSYRRPHSGVQEMYDRPRSGEVRGVKGSAGEDDFYKVPPPSSGGQSVPPRGTRNSTSGDTIDLNSAVPLPIPRRSPRSARSSLSDRPDSVDSFGQSLMECYDVPPPGSHDRPVEVYDVPPPGFSDRPMAEAYDVPPPGMGERPPMEMYDVPPTGSSGDRPMSENYDFPPPRHSASSQEGTPSSSPHPTPPQRPPKPHSLRSPGLYQNMGSKGPGPEHGGGLSAVPAAPPTRCTNSLISYDVPRPSTVVSPPRDSGSILDIAPPRPVPIPRNTGSAGAQAYQNTPPPALPPHPEPHLLTRNGDKRETHVGHGDREAHPHPYPHKPVDMVKTSMGGGGGRGSQDLYQVPPVAPRIPMRSTTMPPNRGGETAAAGPEDVEAHYIWSNVRTKSFKRNHQVNVNASPPPRPPVEPRRPPLPLRNEFASSSDDDDDISVDGNDIQTHVDPGIIRMSTTVPISSEHELEPELKYLDLALDTPPDPSRPQAAGSYGKGTEYREIDFDKTQALQEARRARHL